MGLKADILVVGCGFAGATFAQLAADQGLSVYIIDRREHIGGNCYTYRDEISGVEVHKYGPHIFHTNSSKIWNYINKFSEFNNYVNRVKARTGGRVYGLPINLHTINQFFDAAFSPEEAQAHIDSIRIKDLKPTNFEEFVLHNLGEELYAAFYRDYTKKHWGVDPKEIPVSTAKRLPIRFNYNDNYFNDRYQGIPTEGYTKIFERMLNHELITVGLNEDFGTYRYNWRKQFKHLVFTGSIDEYYDFEEGVLPYRTLTFKEIRGKDIIGNAVLNCTDMTVPFTRIHEHKWFTPEKKFEQSVAFEEYASFTDSRKNPIYPIRNAKSEAIVKAYNERAAKEKDVMFIGRLAEFRYFDMHQVIGAAMVRFEKFMEAHG